MITAECFNCFESFQVPTIWSANYVMMHQIPCRACFEKIMNDGEEE
jgi:hypothetical protein